jgi:hypothetical protein
MPTKPGKPAKPREKGPNRGKSVPRGTISDPQPTYVYRKDAFKKVKIT